MNIQDTGGQFGDGIAQSLSVNALSSGPIPSSGTADAPPQNVFLDLTSIGATDTLNVTVERGAQWTFISEFTFEGTPAAVPLPAGLSMLLAGLGAFGVMRRRA